MISAGQMRGIAREEKLSAGVLFDEKRLSEAQSFWEKGLLHLTRKLPEFEVVISEVKERLSFLEEYTRT